VRERADIFVLIVGARYGSQDESGKSITNMEYLEAKGKGLPVYVFVLKKVLSMLPVWKANPQANYDSVVDTPKLFEFIESLRSSQDHWVFEFEEVAHIVETLGHQLAYLFMEGLALRERVRNLKLPSSLTDLSGKALKFLLERPLGWEFGLFSTVMAEDMGKDQELKWDLMYGTSSTARKALSLIINDLRRQQLVLALHFRSPWFSGHAFSLNVGGTATPAAINALWAWPST
jgi:hypothetical protein